LDNTKSFQRKLIFESNIKQYIDESQTPTDNNLSSFVIVKDKNLNFKMKNKKQLKTEVNLSGNKKLKQKEMRKFENLYTPVSDSIISGSLQSSELDYLKCYK